MQAELGAEILLALIQPFRVRGVGPYRAADDNRNNPIIHRHVSPRPPVEEEVAADILHRLRH